MTSLKTLAATCEWIRQHGSDDQKARYEKSRGLPPMEQLAARQALHDEIAGLSGFSAFAAEYGKPVASGKVNEAGEPMTPITDENKAIIAAWKATKGPESLLEQYAKLPLGEETRAFRSKHPEVFVGDDVNGTLADIRARQAAEKANLKALKSIA